MKLAALQSAFATEQTSLHAEEAALDRQNEAVRQTAAQAVAWQRRSQDATSDAARANAWRLTTAAQIRRETIPADASCDVRLAATEALLRGAAR
jgi:hypothetical protein